MSEKAFIATPEYGWNEVPVDEGFSELPLEDQALQALRKKLAEAKANIEALSDDVHYYKSVKNDMADLVAENKRLLRDLLNQGKLLDSISDMIDSFGDSYQDGE